MTPSKPVLVILTWLMLATVSAHGTTSIQSRPEWTKGPIVMACNWEPLTFIRRRGGHTLEEERNYPLERTEEAARRLKERGVNLVVTNFFKGFGLEAENADIELTREFVQHAHRHGIKVGGYIGSTLVLETFLKEEPTARSWLQIDEYGRPFTYSEDQTFRYVACRNNPDYHAYVLKLLRIAVQDLDLDLIHFDQMQWWPEPKSCRCKYCIPRFQQWLNARYPAGSGQARFGFNLPADILPPAFNVHASPVPYSHLRNPLMQEWAIWRSTELTRQFQEYDRFVHNLDAEVAIEGNPNVDLTMNMGFIYGIDYVSLLRSSDIVWSEEPAYAHWRDGLLISKIRSLKVARRLGNSAFIYTGGRYGTQDPASPPHLRISEAMAFNGCNIGMIGDVHPEGVRLTPEAAQYVRFFLREAPILRASEPIADVAVLRSFSSVEFNPSNALVSSTLAEQLLIQNRIPFDIIFDQQITEIGQYRALILADQDSLSDVQCSAIDDYVRNGGGLVIIGDCSRLNQWRVARQRPGLAFAPDPGGPPRRIEVQKGRVASIASFNPLDKPSRASMNFRFDFHDWTLPDNEAEIIETIRWAAGGRFSAEVVAPPHIALEVALVEEKPALMLHLVNYDPDRPVRDIDGRLKLPAGMGVLLAEYASPDRGEQRIAHEIRDGYVEFMVPEVSVYARILVTLTAE